MSIVPMVRLAGRWFETDADGVPIRFETVLRRVEKETQRGQFTEKDRAAIERLTRLVGKRLGAFTTAPLTGVNPLDGPAVERSRIAQAEGWLSLVKARLAGDVGMTVRVLRELRNERTFEAELRGEIASRTSVQAVTMNVGDQARERELDAKLAAAAEDPAKLALLEAIFRGRAGESGTGQVLDIEKVAPELEARETPPDAEEEGLRAELERLRAENGRIRVAKGILEAEGEEKPGTGGPGRAE